MYTSSIIMLLSWPVTIILAFYAVRLSLHLYEKKVSRKTEDPMVQK